MYETNKTKLNNNNIFLINHFINFINQGPTFTKKKKKLISGIVDSLCKCNLQKSANCVLNANMIR